MKVKKSKKRRADGPSCHIHRKLLVCPSCVAIERGRKGGNRRAKNLTREERQEIGRLGGRPRTNGTEPERPPNVLTPMNR